MSANTDAEGHRILRVGFDANVAPGLEWRLEPEVESIQVRTGKTATVYFRVRNLSDRPTEGHATFNVTPEVSGEYFDKIACFCFTTQHLGPHESAEWPVVFFLDPALEKDQSMARVELDHAVLHAVCAAVGEAGGRAFGRSRRAGGIIVNGRIQ